MALTPRKYSSRHSGRALVISGNMRLFVQRGDLHIHYGYGNERQKLTYTHTGEKPEQIIICGHDYHLTGDALLWCRNAITKTRKSTRRGIAVVQCERGNRSRIMPEFQTLVTPEATKDRPDVRTYQIRAAFDLRDTLGMSIHRYLIGEKIRGQASVLQSHFAGTGAAELLDLAGKIECASTHAEVREIESEAAAIYFEAWERSGVLLWNPVDPDAVPAEWLRFSGRRSPLTDSNKRAVNPVNACLNYGYAVAKAETALAMVAQYLDPAFGIDHMICGDDERMSGERQHMSTYGGVLDVVEALRPVVDGLILGWLSETPLGPDDAVQHRSYSRSVSSRETGIPGQCSLGKMPQEAITDLGPVFYDAIAPHVEHVAKLLHDAAGSPVAMPSRLTKDNHKAMNDKRRKARKAA